MPNAIRAAAPVLEQEEGPPAPGPRRLMSAPIGSDGPSGAGAGAGAGAGGGAGGAVGSDSAGGGGGALGSDSQASAGASAAVGSSGGGAVVQTSGDGEMEAVEVYSVGQKVLAQFAQWKPYQAAVITAAHADGTYDVEYHDGDEVRRA